MKTIAFNGTTYTCTLSDRFRRHTADEMDAMREPARDGIRVAVRIYRDTDLGLDNCVLDGEGRLTLAAELGLPPAKVPFYREPPMSTEDAYALARTLNDCRRHDDPEAVRKRRLEVVAQLRRDGKSIRAIAAETGVSKAQAERDVEEVRQVSPPGTPEPETVTGQDGKTYPVTRTTTEEPPEEAEAEAPPPPMNNSLPQPSHDASTKRQPPPWLVPGGKPIDPDHPFADELKKLTAVAASITSKLRALPPDHPVMQALIEFGTRIRVELGKQKPRSLPFLEFSSDVIDGCEVKEGKVKFVALQQVRRILRVYGPRKRYVPGSAIKDFIADPEGEA